jgi:hypothetical protein
MIRRLLFAWLLTGTLAATASGGTDYGQFCWDASGFFDRLRISLTIPDGDYTMYAMPAAEWNSPGNGGYRLRGHGSASPIFSPAPSIAPPSSFVMSLDFDNDSTSFLGNPDCKFRATINGPALNGSLVARCTGGPGTVFNNTTALTLVDCDDSEVSSHRSVLSVMPRFGAEEP